MRYDEKRGKVCAYGDPETGRPCGKLGVYKTIGGDSWFCSDHAPEVKAHDLKIYDNPRRVRPNTGEPDQDYDHEFFDAIVRQLDKAGFKGATHKMFDQYQGVYLHVPGVDKFWVVDSHSTGTPDSKPETKWRAVQLVDRDGSVFSATRGDYFMKPKNYVLKDFVLRLQGFDGKWKDIENPTIGDLPDLLEVRGSFTYKKGTRTDITVFQGEKTQATAEVRQTEDGVVDASELVDVCREIAQKGRVNPLQRKGGLPHLGDPKRFPGRIFGSQYRETLAQAGYRLHKRLPHGEAVLEDLETGKLELYALSDDFAGHAIEIDGKGYEFVRDYHPARSNPITVEPGPEGRSVWQQWKRRMRGASSSDLSDAYVWFMELYDAGRTGKSMPYSSAPQGADERAAWSAGRDDKGIRRFPPTMRENPDDIRRSESSKFGSVIDELFWQLSLDGGPDEELGESESFGWYGKMAIDRSIIADLDRAAKDAGVEPLNEAERKYVLSHAGVIIFENSQGFVNADFFRSKPEFEGAWQDLEAEYEKFERAE